MILGIQIQDTDSMYFQVRCTDSLYDIVCYNEFGNDQHAHYDIAGMVCDGDLILNFLEVDSFSSDETATVTIDKEKFENLACGTKLLLPFKFSDGIQISDLCGEASVGFPNVPIGAEVSACVDFPQGSYTIEIEFRDVGEDKYYGDTHQLWGSTCACTILEQYSLQSIEDQLSLEDINSCLNDYLPGSNRQEYANHTRITDGTVAVFTSNGEGFYYTPSMEDICLQEEPSYEEEEPSYEEEESSYEEEESSYEESYETPDIGCLLVTTGLLLFAEL